jgi:succinyl-CoA synthetase beta subunit
MLGRVLVTVQTGPKGKQVNRLYIEEGADIARELYLSLLVDRETARVAVVASTEGGMDIEGVAHDTPEKILTFSIDPATGVQPHHARTLAKSLALEGPRPRTCRSCSPSSTAPSSRPTWRNWRSTPLSSPARAG